MIKIFCNHVFRFEVSVVRSVGVKRTVTALIVLYDALRCFALATSQLIGYASCYVKKKAKCVLRNQMTEPVC